MRKLQQYNLIETRKLKFISHIIIIFIKEYPLLISCVVQSSYVGLCTIFCLIILKRILFIIIHITLCLFFIKAINTR